MVVYLDAVWLLNLLIDACLLKLTAVMLKRKMATIRLILGTLTASSIVLIFFTPVSPLIDHPLGKLLFSSLIILITFGFGRFTVFFQNLAAFYFVAFAIGGGLFAIHFFFISDTFYAGGSVFTTPNFGDPISWIAVAVGFPALFLFSRKRIEQTAVHKWRSASGAAVTIRVAHQVIHADGLIDSGNGLYDPLTRLPVMFLTRAACGSAVPEPLLAAARGAEPFSLIDGLAAEWTARLSWVPFSSVDGSARYLIAFRPDQVLVRHEGKCFDCGSKVLVALTEHRLSPLGEFGSLLHPDMLLKGKIVESAS
ncbi:MAG: sigma-E processing peptidase SpoIIGA [Sporolactobacillus sp.]|jgi:stage II sporulation protein GA (sporulation sigma-E factor processing peptidase)|nr:sigma-E processing peptidase SpoIIGA [Sporolactobacillus sp.]